MFAGRKIVIAIAFSLSFVSAQELLPNATSITVTTQNEKESIKEKVSIVADPQLAMSMPNYPVTAGDIYTLAFAAGTTPVQYTLLVDLSNKIKVANLGILNCKDLTYNQLKAQVDYLVRQNYPMSGTQFVLTTPSIFLVSIKGEIAHAQEEKAWALTRLSSFVTPYLTPYSSIRDIMIVSVDGKKNTYDLFKAQRNGDFTQDPYMRPGDTIIINRSKRKVEIKGSIERPGTYELLAGEELAELITTYASGITSTADTSRIRLVRIDESATKLEKVLYLTKADIENNYPLKDKDKILIPDWAELQPFIELKGVIKNPLNMEYESNINSAQNSTIYKTRIPVYVDETYTSLVRRIKYLLTDFSDIAGIYIERNGTKIVLKADCILQDMSFESTYRVQQNDVLIVPYLPIFTN